MAKLFLLISLIVYSCFSYSDICKEVALSATQFAIHKKEYREWLKKGYDASETIPAFVLTIEATRSKLSNLGLSERDINSIVRTITRSKFSETPQLEMNRAYYYYLVSCKLLHKKKKILSFKKSSPKIIACLDSSSVYEADPSICIEQAIKK